MSLSCGDRCLGRPVHRCALEDWRVFEIGDRPRFGPVDDLLFGERPLLVGERDLLLGEFR